MVCHHDQNNPHIRQFSCSNFLAVVLLLKTKIHHYDNTGISQQMVQDMGSG